MHRNNLYFQSNIEDIIVYIKNEIDTLGGFCYPRSSADTGILKSSNISSDSENIFASEDSQVNKRRSMVEQKLGRKNKAFGYPFLANAPYLSVSETEAHCIHNNKRVHRLLAYI